MIYRKTGGKHCIAPIFEAPLRAVRDGVRHKAELPYEDKQKEFSWNDDDSCYDKNCQ